MNVPTDAHYRATGARRRFPAFSETSEDGNILLLCIGYVLVIVLMVLLTATLSSLHLERKRLLSLADSAALVASDSLARQTYEAELAHTNPKPADSTATQDVKVFLAQASENSGLDHVHLIAVRTVATGEVAVELGTTTSVLTAFDLTGPKAFQVTMHATGHATALPR
ncbi:pilus assembly protein TadG-related protein [Jonesiaceae bacterium BS-20]|uniref:Pilus assembly protein TadG-related protein n=1 Tax=Jonesiaceae bacterium BS-20 TaxID=3120821 RepID=A0AAU7DYI0_9MICO